MRTSSNCRTRTTSYAKPGVEETPWGSREMSIKDPFGNRVVFVEEVRRLTD